MLCILRSSGSFRRVRYRTSFLRSALSGCSSRPKRLGANISDSACALAPPEVPTADKPPDLEEECNLIRGISERIRYKFQDATILQLALNPCQQPAHSRLEYLGDCFLSVILREALLGEFPSYSSGDITPLHDTLANNAFLCILAQEIGVVEYFISKGTSGVTSDALEAIIGAVYLDSSCDLEVTRRVVLQLYGNLQARLRSQDFDLKGRLMRWVQSKGENSRVLFSSKRVEGTPVMFEASAVVHRTVGVGTGYSLRDAEEQAASNALDNLGFVKRSEHEHIANVDTDLGSVASDSLKAADDDTGSNALKSHGVASSLVGDDDVDSAITLFTTGTPVRFSPFVWVNGIRASSEHSLCHGPVNDSVTSSAPFASERASRNSQGTHSRKMRAPWIIRFPAIPRSRNVCDYCGPGVHKGGIGFCPQYKTYLGESTRSVKIPRTDRGFVYGLSYSDFLAKKARPDITPAPGRVSATGTLRHASRLCR